MQPGEPQCTTLEAAHVALCQERAARRAAEQRAAAASEEATAAVRASEQWEVHRAGLG